MPGAVQFEIITVVGGSGYKYAEMIMQTTFQGKDSHIIKSHKCQ